MDALRSFLVETDCVCDYVPFVSSLSNLVDLFQKSVILPFMAEKTILSNHYFEHLDQKKYLRCLILIIPVIGNLIVGIYDFSLKNNEMTITHVSDFDHPPSHQPYYYNSGSQNYGQTYGPTYDGQTYGPTYGGQTYGQPTYGPTYDGRTYGGQTFGQPTYGLS
jgi:hypothetical protein